MPISGNVYNADQLMPVFAGLSDTHACRFAANLTLTAGTVVAQNSSTGEWAAYANGGPNGLGTARGILAHDVRTDAQGRVTLGDQTPGEWGESKLTGAVFFRGAFRRGDLTGLDAGAISALMGRFVTGNPAGTSADDVFLF